MKFDKTLCTTLLLANSLLSSELLAESSFSCYERADKQQQSKSVGGNPLPDSLKHYPWMVNLNAGVPHDPVCGGTLINTNLVVTAAHCLVDKSGNLDIDPEELYVRQADADGKADGERRRVVNFQIHEKYNASNSENDIALLLLESPFDISPHNIIRMLNPETAVHWGRPNDCAKLLGWGLDESGKGAEVINEVNLKLWDNQHCAKHFDDGSLPDSQLCAGYTKVKKDACRGDSGGPLVIKGGPSQHLLVGLVSWGRYCHDDNTSPSAYTRVASFDDWVRETAGSLTAD